MSRFLKLCGLFTLVIVIGGGIAAYLYLKSSAFDRWIEERVVAYLQERFNVSVDLGKVDFEPFGWKVTIEDLALASSLYPEERPAIKVSKVVLNFEVLDFLKPEVRLNSLDLERPELRLLENPEGELNITQMFRPRRPPVTTPGTERRPFSPVRLAIGEIVISAGTFEFADSSVRFDTTGDNLQADLQFQSASQSYTGSLAIESFSLSVNEAEIPVSGIASEFSLFENSLDLRNTHIWSPQLDAQVRGRITDLRRLHYEIEVDHAQIRMPALTTPNLSSYVSEGTLETSGKLRGEGSELVYTGTFETPTLSLGAFGFQNLAGNVVVNREGLRLEDLRGRFGEGDLSGESQLYWKEGISRLEISLSQARISRILAQFGVSPLPIRGRADFKGSFDWPTLEFSLFRGQISTTSQGQFLLTTGSTATPDEIPFKATAQFSYADNTFQTQDGVISTPSTSSAFSLSVDTQGALDLAGGLRSAEASELTALGTAFGLIPQAFLDEYPLGLNGDSRVRMSISKESGHPLSIRSTLEIAEASYRGTYLGPLSAEINYDESGIRFDNLWLSTPAYSVSASVELSSDEEDRTVVDSEIAYRDVPVSLLSEALTGEASPVDGRLSGQSRLGYTQSSGLSAEGTVEVPEIAISGELVEALAGQYKLQNGSLQIDHLRARLFGGQVQGQGNYAIEQERFEAELFGTGLRMDQINAAKDRISVNGVFNLQIAGEGTLDDPRLTIKLASPELAVAEKTLRDVQLTGVTAESLARFQLGARFLDQRLTLQGEAALEDPFHFKVWEAPQSLRVERILEDIAGIEDSEFVGVVEVGISAEGDLTDPESVVVRGTIQNADFTAQGYQLQSVGTADILYQNDVLTFSSLGLRGQNTNLKGRGEIRLEPAATLTARIEGDVNLELVNAFVESASIGGLAELQTDMMGPLTSPRIAGSAQIKNATYSSLDSPVQISDANGTFKFTANQISVDEFSLKTQYGPVNLEGGIFLDGFTPHRWQLNAYGYGLRFEFPKDVQSMVDVDIDLIKSDQSQMISGVVYVRSAEYLRELSLAEFVLELTKNQALSPPPASEASVSLDIEIESYRSIRINNNLANIVASADCSIIGTIDDPVLMGSIVVDEGQLFLEGNEYDFNQGTITFSNPRKTTPFFNLEARTDVREFTVSVLLRGPSDNLKVSFRSDPPLATASIVSLLAAGQTQEEIFGSEDTGRTASSSLAVYGAGALLSKTLGERIESQTSRLFGFEKFSIDPFLDSSRSRDPGARITLGKQLTKKLGMTYMTTLGQELQGQTLVIQYRLTDWVTLVGTSESDGSVALDFKFRKRF